MATAAPLVEPVPLALDETQTYRVGGTRVTLDTLAAAHRMGRTPEQIVESFSALQLADVYAVIAWMLRHTAEVDAYLARREQQAAELRRKIERYCPPNGLPEKLLSRMLISHAHISGRREL